MEEAKTNVAVQEETIFSQSILVMNHLQNIGGITQDMAKELYGIGRLAAVICMLKKRGVKIDRKWCSGLNRYGRKVRWVEYFI